MVDKYGAWQELQRRADADPAKRKALDELIKRGTIQPVDMSVDDMGRGFARGVPVIGGAMDEIAAAGDTLVSYPFDWINENITGFEPRDPDWREMMANDVPMGERYSRALRKERDRDEWFDTEHPVASGATKLAGGLASGGAMLRAAPGAAGAMFGGKTVPEAMLRSAVSSGLMGGAHAFADGEDGAGNRASGAVVPALISGGLGAAMPMVTAGFDKAWNSIFPGAATKPTNQAAKIVQRAVADDGGAPAAGPLVNAGPNTRAVAEVAGETPGPAANFLRQSLEDVEGLTPEVRAALQGANKRAADSAAATAFNKAPRPGVDAAGVAESVLNLNFGTAGRKTITAIAKKLATGNMDDAALETLRYMMREAPDAIGEIEELAAKATNNENTRMMIGNIVRTLAAPTYTTGGSF